MWALLTEPYIDWSKLFDYGFARLSIFFVVIPSWYFTYAYMWVIYRINKSTYFLPRSKFFLKELGDWYYFFRGWIIHNKDGLFLTQSRYALDRFLNVLLWKIGHISTPLSTSHKIRKYVTIYSILYYYI